MDKIESSDESIGVISWSPRFSVGVAMLDEQHERLVDMVNKVITVRASATNREVVVKLLRDMVEYSESHFKAEEALLQEHGYPECSDQEELHLEFVEKTASLSRAYYDHDEAVQLDLMRYLKHWWVDHILIEDMKYKEFLQEKGVS